jgi:hypothetical protein
VVWLFRAFLVLILLSATALPGQEEAPGANPQNQFFAGNVTALSEGKITVARTILGKTTATKTFVIKPETKIEGKLRLKAKVTVRYATDEDENADVAVDIIVRK